MVKGTVKLVLKKTCQCKAILVSLIGEEWVDVSCGSGKTRRARKEEINIHSEVIQISGEGLLDFVEKNFEFKIPEDAPPTIKGMRQDFDGWCMQSWDVPMGRDKNERVEVFVY